MRPQQVPERSGLHSISTRGQRGLRAAVRLLLWLRGRPPRNVLKLVVETLGPGSRLRKPSAPLMRDGPKSVREHERIENAMASPPGALIARLVHGIGARCTTAR